VLEQRGQQKRLVLHQSLQGFSLPSDVIHRHSLLGCRIQHVPEQVPTCARPALQS
jgi:hypothetical protein